MIEISFDELRRRVKYNPDSGKLFWLPLNREDFRCAGTFAAHRYRFASREAFTTLNSKGYFTAVIMQRRVSAHRVAFALGTGRWPEGEVDHINGDKTDNRLANLREVTREGNQRNQKLHVTNRTGVSGVEWKCGKWQVRLSKKYLGTFTSFEDACAVRLSAEREAGYHPNHGRAA